MDTKAAHESGHPEGPHVGFLARELVLTRRGIVIIIFYVPQQLWCHPADTPVIRRRVGERTGFDEDTGDTEVGEEWVAAVGCEDVGLGG
jgi:hypothetical protein